MAKQLTLLDDIPAAPHEGDDSVTFTATEVIRRRIAYDAWHEVFLRHSYNQRREAILASGDVYWIANLNRHDERERKRQ